jgi:3-methyl-2-oxobutanoate hydroxymethyltransferase
MSAVSRTGDRKITVPEILSRKSLLLAGSTETKKITCLTAYDYPSARLLDEADVGILLVGDSLAMVALGYDNTLPITLDDMLMGVRAVRRGTRRALLVADMPYGSSNFKGTRPV